MFPNINSNQRVVGDKWILILGGDNWKERASKVSFGVASAIKSEKRTESR